MTLDKIYISVRIIMKTNIGMNMKVGDIIQYYAYNSRCLGLGLCGKSV